MDLLEQIAVEDLVVRFTAKWCGPCKKMTPIIDELKTEGFNFVDVDVDENPTAMDMFGIQSVPTFIRFVDGKIANRVSGAYSKMGSLKKLDLTEKN